MTTAGWILLVLSWGLIGSLCGYCIWRTVRARPRELSAPLDIEREIDQQG